MAQREPGTLIELFVPFIAHVIGCRGLGQRGHEVGKPLAASRWVCGTRRGSTDPWRLRLQLRATCMTRGIKVA